MEQEPIYPIGEQSFERIRRSGAVYADKTDLIYKMTHKYRTVFLSRPRRFGKSLLTRTIQRYFEGRKELFSGLYMEKLEKDWVAHPVLRFDFSTVKGSGLQDLKDELNRQLDGFEKLYGTARNETSPGKRLGGMIQRAYEQTGMEVVLLVDEYDAPILEVLNEPERIDGVRTVMREFYSQIKFCEDYLRFVFLTGISTFSQLGMFSELNNLKNITNDDDYASICGITIPELKDNFDYGIRKFAEKEGCTPDVLIDKLRDQYDGYHFTKGLVDVFNPFSLLNAFSDCELNSYWFQTGTPSFAVNMLRAHQGEWTFDIESIESMEPMVASKFNTPLESARGPLPFLYQAGYFTIKDYVKEDDMYILGVPNTEVRLGLIQNLIPLYSSMDPDDTLGVARRMSNALNRGDYDKAFRLAQSFLAGLPYMAGEKDILADALRCEMYYHKILYTIFSLLHKGAHAQVRQAVGMPDIVVKTKKYIYVIEVKINSTPQVALEQIEAKQYAAPYLTDGREIVKLGVNFSSKTRTVDAWERGE
jgi:hypothetical protein